MFCGRRRGVMACGSCDSASSFGFKIRGDGFVFPTFLMALFWGQTSTTPQLWGRQCLGQDSLALGLFPCSGIFLILLRPRRRSGSPPIGAEIGLLLSLSRSFDSSWTEILLILLLALVIRERRVSSLSLAPERRA